MPAADPDDFSKIPFTAHEPAADLIPVACLPGLLCSPAVFMWMASEPARAAGVELLPVPWLTWPGLGLEGIADLIASELQAHIDPPVIVAAHSGSGPLALLICLRHPGLVAGLVLACTGPNYRDHLDVHDVCRGLAHSSSWDLNFLNDYFGSCFADAPNEQLMDQLVQYAQQLDLTHASKILSELVETDLEPELKRIKVPAAVIHGRADRSRPLSHAQRLTGGIRHSRLFLLDCGHTPMIEDPDNYWQALSWVIAESRQRLAVERTIR